MKLHACFSALLLALSLSPAVDAATYIAERYDIEGATNGNLWAINNRNQVVGSASFADGYKNFYGTLGATPIFFDGPASSISTSLTGISDDGSLVGSFSTALVDDGDGGLMPGRENGFVWDSAGGFSFFELAGAESTIVRGISANGRYIVGYSMFDDHMDAWMMDRTKGVYEAIASGSLTLATGVNNDGVAVGSGIWVDEVSGSVRRAAFTYKDGVRTDFQLVDQINSKSRAINNDGLMAGHIVSRDGMASAFIGGVDDYSVVMWNDMSTYAYGVNDSGIAVGMAVDGTGSFYQSLVFRAVPEPVSFGLVFIALAAAAVGRRTRSDQ